jgi:hypothetical protein
MCNSPVRPRKSVPPPRNRCCSPSRRCGEKAGGTSSPDVAYATAAIPLGRLAAIGGGSSRETPKVSSFPASQSWKSVRLQISQSCNQLQSFTHALRSWRPSDFVGPTGSDQAAGADVVIGGLIRLGCGIRCPEIQCSLRSAFPQRGKLPTLSAHPARRRRPSIARPGAAVSAGIAAYPACVSLSRSSPSGPFSAKRCCQRLTIGRLTSVSVATCCTGRLFAQQAPPRPVRCTCAVGCGPMRSPQAASCPTRSITRI